MYYINYWEEMMQFVRQIGFLIVFACISLQVSAQYIVSFPYNPNEESPRDKYPLEYKTDISLKESLGGEIVDDIFVGPVRIGVDERKINHAWDELYKTPLLLRGIGPDNDSLLITSHDEIKDPVPAIKGHPFPYVHFTPYRSTEPIRWTTFDELRKEYFPDVQEPVVYTINKYIVPDPTFFKLDHDFIGRIERLDSRDIEALKAFPPFTFIRIFTKTRHNWYWNLNSYGLEE